MIELVGITGPARHGKDTVAKMILEVCPGFTRFAFADKMKEMAQACFTAEHPDDGAQWKEGEQQFIVNWVNMVSYLSGPFGAEWKLYMPCTELAAVLERLTSDFEEGDTSNEATFTGSWRLIYQVLGTDWGRQTQDENMWVDFLPLDKPTIVTDVRGHGDCDEWGDRNNEALTIKQAGGIILRVVDPRKGGMVRDHASEAAIDSHLIDYTIVNDGNLEDLRRSVMDFVYILLMSDC